MCFLSWTTDRGYKFAAKIFLLAVLTSYGRGRTSADKNLFCSLRKYLLPMETNEILQRCRFFRKAHAWQEGAKFSILFFLLLKVIHSHWSSKTEYKNDVKMRMRVRMSIRIKNTISNLYRFEWNDSWEKSNYSTDRCRFNSGEYSLLWSRLRFVHRTTD